MTGADCCMKMHTSLTTIYIKRMIDQCRLSRNWVITTHHLQDFIPSLLVMTPSVCHKASDMGLSWWETEWVRDTEDGELMEWANVWMRNWAGERGDRYWRGGGGRFGGLDWVRERGGWVKNQADKRMSEMHQWPSAAIIKYGGKGRNSYKYRKRNSILRHVYP
jgi:hypothetical protein